MAGLSFFVLDGSGLLKLLLGVYTNGLHAPVFFFFLLKPLSERLIVVYTRQ